MKTFIFVGILLSIVLIKASDNEPQTELQLNNNQNKKLQQHIKQISNPQQNQQQQQSFISKHHKKHQKLPKQQLKQQQQHKQQYKRKGKRHRNRPRTRDVGKYLYNNNNNINNINNKNNNINNDPLNLNNNYCELELQCKGDVGSSSSLPIKLPIRGPRGPPGKPGQVGENGLPGFPGLPGTGGTQKKVAFFAGLTDNFGPVQDNTEVIFDRVITNIGSAYSPSTGRFTAPSHGAYQFNVVVSAQGRNKAAVMVLKNGEMVATVWAESIPYWSTSSNHVILSMDKGDQVWLILLNKASYLHGYMYTTFSGFVLFDL